MPSVAIVEIVEYKVDFKSQPKSQPWTVDSISSEGVAK